MSIYQAGVPTGRVDLDIDYQNIQNNFRQLNTTFSVDHLAFDNQTAQNGYHTSIHFNPVSTVASNAPNNKPINNVPAAVAKIAQLFGAQLNDGFGTDSSLFFLSGANKLTQMTSNFLPSSTTNGCSFLPGGLAFQWGFVTKPSLGWIRDVSTPFSFSSPQVIYPNNNFIVLATLLGTNTSSSQGTIYIVSKSTTGFNWAFSGSSSTSFSGFCWISIGN